MQLVKAGKGRWSDRAEAMFLAELGVTGCVRRAARAAGFSTTALYARRKAHPDFADRWDEASAAAETYLRSLVLGAGIAAFDPFAEAEGEVEGARPRVTVAEAISILRLRGSSSATGGGGLGRHSPEEPSIEEVRDEVLQRLAAIRAHEEGRDG